LQLQQDALKASGLLMAGLIVLTAGKDAAVAAVGMEAWYVGWFLTAAAMGIASLSVFVNPATYFKREVRWVLFPCALLAVSMILINNYDALLKPTWKYVGPMIAASTF